MSPEVINMTCPGCGAPISTGTKECECCGRPLVIRTFKTLVDLDSIQTNKYTNEYRKILAADPNNPDINKAMGLTLMKLGQYDQATRMLDIASTYNLIDADAFFFSGISRLGGKRPAFVKRDAINESISKIEAAKSIEAKGIYDYALGIIKFDYFYRKGFNTSPSFEECLDAADSLGVSESDIDELNAMMKIDSRNLPPVD